MAGVEGASESLFDESDHVSESLEERAEVKKLGVEVDDESRGREGTRKELTVCCWKTEEGLGIDAGEGGRMVVEDILVNGDSVLMNE